MPVFGRVSFIVWLISFWESFFFGFFFFEGEGVEIDCWDGCVCMYLDLGIGRISPLS